MGKKDVMGQIARERICRLFELAGKEFSEHPERSDRYVQLALKIGKRCNESVPWELKKNYCKKCKSYLKEGRNSKIRIEGSILKITCNKCGFTRKTSVSGEKKQQE
jgi:ribonuclease P protein subunit RPR2